MRQVTGEGLGYSNLLNTGFCAQKRITALGGVTQGHRQPRRWGGGGGPQKEACVGEGGARSPQQGGPRDSPQQSHSPGPGCVTS